MRLRKKKSLIDQAGERVSSVLDTVVESVQDFVEDVEENWRPQVESAEIGRAHV